MKNIMLVVLMLLSGSVHAELSKWVDDKGEVHYSDNPPKHTPNVYHPHFKDTLTAPPADNPYAPKSTKEMEEDFQRGKAARDNAAKKEEQARAAAATKQANCTAARSNLAGLQQTRRMFKTDESGERVYLDESQRQQQLDAAQQAVNASCN